VKNTTLCYLRRDGKWLLLYRNKKPQDINRGKWIGVGGHQEEAETPLECVRREVLEETGLTVQPRLRGLVTFISDEWETEECFLYTAESFTGELQPCPEGELAWVPEEEILSLALWEGDRVFLPLLIRDAPFFYLKLRYEGEHVAECVFL